MVRKGSPRVSRKLRVKADLETLDDRALGRYVS
jgi:hypothetical protein